MKNQLSFPKATRRTLLKWGGFTALSGAAGLWIMQRGFLSFGTTMIEDIYGADIAASSASQSFLLDLDARLSARESYVRRAKDHLKFGTFFPAGRFRSEREEWRAQLISLFTQSTNITEIETNGGELEYFGLYDPYGTPCINRLSDVFRDA